MVAFKALIFFILVLAVTVGALPTKSEKGFYRLPTDFEKVLPATTITELKSVLNDSALSDKEKNQKIDKIMTALSSEILDKIPPPPGFTELPKEIQEKLKFIARNPKIDYEEKSKQTQAVIKTLPEKYRHLLPAFRPTTWCLFRGLFCWT